MKNESVREYQRKMRIRSGVEILIVSVIMIVVTLGIRVAVDYVFGKEDSWFYNVESPGGQSGELTEEEQDSASPLLLQTDRRWANASYGNSNIKKSGCGPTCMSMVVVGLTHNKEATPKAVADFAAKEGYYKEGKGTSWEFMREGGEHWGVQGVEISLSYKSIKKHLAKGEPIICSMGPGDFADEGHFIVLIGMENGQIKLHDPNSEERSNCLWDYETLESQIKNLWAFSKE